MSAKDMTDKEIIESLNQNTALNRARRVFSSESARIEQAGQQRKALGAIDLRRMEFLAVEKIAKELGVTL